MVAQTDITNMAVFCDFENVALGVADAKYAKFDIGKVLERLLLKGSIVVKKAYCDWDRYKGFKPAMHEASFEMIEIPHVRMSGKNSADIRMVVDALDLCYTKSHVDTFVIISGDSDFSPLVSKLRENNKEVIGVGVKNSSSDLLVSNCDEFIFYDDLVREDEAKRRAAHKRSEKRAATPAKQAADYAKKKGVTFVNHTFTSHLALAASIVPFADMAKHTICEYPVELKAVAKAITKNQIGRDKNGQVRAPDAPGLGVDIDEAALDAFTVQRERITR